MINHASQYEHEREKMVFSVGDKATIINSFIDLNWRGQEICRQFKSKNWARSSVDQLIQRYEKSGSYDRTVGSSRPVSASTAENEEALLKLTESQESQPGSSMSLRKASQRIGITKSSASRISKSKNRKSVKRIVTPQLTAGAVQRRFTRSRNLYTRYNAERIKLLAWQDEKDFTLQVPSNRQNNRIFITGKKSDVNPSRLYHPANKFTKKIMVSCLISWNGVSKPFFVDPGKQKVDAKYFANHLKRDLVPALHDLYPDGDGIYVQDGASAHTSNLAQDYLKEVFGRDGFVNKNQWPPKSPDLNPLDYYFWNAVKEKVYEGRREPFTNLAQLKRRIKYVWDAAFDEEASRKAITEFRKRLRAVVVNKGGPIVHLFA